ncbi:uncharacterized protein LOC129770588 [Toxorhynchites rutilus septentrionalis]|uniref:uncharacterized protein LOC129770588 n=1 Tax=Toxorhynchites rutilus septentrionalis TaxID=329112 RepID=UPI002478F098|nr:uncharacterized protein LOC129770588 [Toxorhynchites rutilus septentrionalis]
MNSSIFTTLLGTTLLLLLLHITSRLTSAEIDPEQSCIPGTISSIKVNLIRTLILCYVYGCPEEVTQELADDFNTFQHYDRNGTNTDEDAAKKVPKGVLSKLAKLTSAIEKDRTAALTVCTDWVSLLNKLILDLTQAKSSCFLEPAAKYPADMSLDGAEIDCDEMTVYMKQLQKYYGAECESKGKDCSDKMKQAANWFGRAYKQLGRNCYYDAYDYLD